MHCTDGWRITGYYLPLEVDFHQPPLKIQVEGIGADPFPADFLDATKMEGWGQTRYGWFLGWSKHHWVKSQAPLNAHGQPLRIGSIAVDPAVIPNGSKVQIPSAPPPWNQQTFVAD